MRPGGQRGQGQRGQGGNEALGLSTPKHNGKSGTGDSLDNKYINISYRFT
jgi:hypothetical protein